MKMYHFNAIFFVLASILFSSFSNGFLIATNRRIKLPLAAKKMPYKSIEDMIEKIETPLLLDVYAVWCGPCKMLAPEIAQLSKQMKNEIQVAKMDSDKHTALASKLRVEGLPTCILFKGGKEIHRMTGYLTANQMEQQLRQALSSVQ